MFNRSGVAFQDFRMDLTGATDTYVIVYLNKQISMLLNSMKFI